jgi:Phage terminase, small subunit
MVRGRKPKTADQLKVFGGRKDRIAQRKQAPQPSGAPERPANLEGDAAWHWDFAVRQLAELGVVTRLDTMELTIASETWGLYRAAADAAKLDPLDKDTRIAVVQYKTAWEASAAKLGLNPTDRQRLKIEKHEPSDFDSHMEQHA